MVVKHKGFKGIFDDAKHPRDSHGQFAETADAPNTKVVLPKGKTPPANWKFYKPGYTPKGWDKLGSHAKLAGKKLWERKKNGDFANDYEFWLAAQQLASKSKKTRGTQAPTPNAIVNAAFRHELESTGEVKIQGNITQNATSVKSDLGVPQVHSHGKTSNGIDITSKHAPPGTLTTYKKTMPGASGAQVWVDNKGQEWLVKGLKPGSNAYGVKFAVALEEGAAKIQNKAGLRSATSHKVVLDTNSGGKHEVLAQKMFGDVKPAFTGSPDIETMLPQDKLEMQKQQILDWVISNHDTHTGNFLADKQGVIGVDKGQAFKYFGKDKLDWNYVGTVPLGGDKLTYQTMWNDYVAGKGDLLDFSTSPELLTFAHRLENINDDEYKALLRPYAEAAASQGILSYPGKASAVKPEQWHVDKFLDAAVARKNNVVNDFATFYGNAEQARIDNKAASTPKTKFKGEHGDHIGFDQLEVGDKFKYNGVEYQASYVGKNALLAKIPNGNPNDEETKISASDLNAYGATIIKHGTSVTAADLGGLVANHADIIPGDKITYKDDPEQLTVTKVQPSGINYKKESGAMGAIHKTTFDNGDIKYATIDPNSPAAQATPTHNGGASGLPKSTSASNIPPALIWLDGVETKLAPGYNIFSANGEYHIVKPNGESSKNPQGIEKSWPTAQAALDSSTMAKYKALPPPYVPPSAYTPGEIPSTATEADQLLSITSAQVGPGAKYASINIAEITEYVELQDKWAEGKATAEEFLKYKTLKQTLNNKIKDSAKAGGAAHIVDEPVDSFAFGAGAVVNAPSPGVKSKLPTPAFKKKGGAPPALAKATGPNAHDDGKSLYDRKKSGEFNSDDELWKAASKLSNAAKAKAAKANPDKKPVSGEDYSSPNQIRNVAMRLEYDDTGDVVWETKAEKTSQTEKQSHKGSALANALHKHVGKIANAKHTPSKYNTLSTSIWSDTSKPVGGYTNPHAFEHGDSAAIRNYGDKYVNHSSWQPEQKSAWYAFSGGASGSINSWFRVGAAGFSDPQGHTATTASTYAKGLLDAFKSPNLKPLDDWTVVTRGTSGGWEFGIGSDTASFDDVKAQEGKIVRNKCPVSSSLRTTPAFSGGFRITYKLPPGFKGLWLGAKSAHSSEDEMILPPGMAYKIVEVKKGASGYGTEVLVEVVDVKLPESV